MSIEVTENICRYVNHLDPTVNKESWSDNELEVLYNKYN